MSRPRKTNLHLPQYVVVHHGSYWYRPPTGENVLIAPIENEHLMWKFMADKTEPTSPKATLREYFARYVREVVPSLGVRTQKDYKRHLEILDKHFGHMKPDDLLPKDIGQFLDRKQGKIQANRQVAVLSAVYTKMVGRWYVADRNPCIGVERNPSKKRIRYVTDTEYTALYQSASIRLQLAMDLALITGQRQGDLLSLEWKSVTPEGILFQQQKTGKRLRVKISPALQAVLDLARLLPPTLHIGGYVIRTRSGRPYTSEGFRACWQRTMNRAMATGLLQERFTFHDIRAKCVSDTSSLEKAMERAGHTSMAMTRGVYDRGIRDVEPLK